MDDHYESSSILPKRVNEPPVVFRGCTAAETVAIGALSLAFWLLVGGPIGFALGIGWVVLGLVFFLTGGTVYGLATALRAMKKGRPSGYFAQKVRLWLEQYGLSESHLFQGDGTLELGRTKQYLSANRIERYPDPEELEDPDELVGLEQMSGMPTREGG